MTRIVAARIDPRIVVLDLAGTIDYKSYKTTRVNQGTALKTCHVARRHSFYPITSPPSRDVWNVFDCEGRDTLEISVLERHPYTTQTLAYRISPQPEPFCCIPDKRFSTMRISGMHQC
ncbi:hypothetical protein PYCC9005_004419 [Savitreella phatthalungensis]